MTRTDTLPPVAETDIRAAIGCFVLAILLFAGMDTLVKFLSASFPVPQLMFMRSVVALVLVGGIALARDGWVSLRTRRPLGHVGRSLAGLLSMGCFFTAFRQLPLAEVYVLSFSGPLFITALSVPLLGEPVGWRRWAAVLVGFGGVVVMARPEAGAPVLPVLIGVAAAFFYALAAIGTRGLARTESNAAIVVYLLLTTTAVSGVAVFPVWIHPGPAEAVAMLALGVLGGAAQVLMTQAFRLAPVAVVAPFEYSGMVWATLFGFLVFGETPTAAVFAGGGIVIASGLYILHRETMRRAGVS